MTTPKLPSGGDSGRNVARTVNLLSSGQQSLTEAIAAIVGLTDGNKGDITVSGTGAAWAINNDAVTDAKLRNSAAVSVIGRSANSTGDPADITASANAQVLCRLADALGFSSVSALLDAAFSSTQGSLLYRNTASWLALGPATATYVLTTGGSGANPSWARPPAWVRHAIVGTTSGSTQSTTDIPACSAILLALNGVSHNSGSNQSLRVALSSNNGSSYGTARNISASVSGGTNLTGQAWIMEVGTSGANKDILPNVGASGSASTYRDLAVESTVTGVTNALQFSPSGGSFDGGAIVVYYA